MRWFFGTLLALLAAVGIYLGSALVSLGGLVEAARAGDGAGILARTDAGRLRRSLVDQIVSAYLKQLGSDRPVKPLERVLANTYGATVADAMIAKMLTGENLTRILKTGAISSANCSVGSNTGPMSPPAMSVNVASFLGVISSLSSTWAVFRLP